VTQPQRDESGASAVEYGLLLAGIAAVVVAAIFAFGGFVTNMFSGSCNTIAAVVTGGSC
jgi:pilus assembly protein Flp/PilA